MDDVEAYIWNEDREPEELYDLQNDPYEINNLAGDADYSAELERHRKILERWISRTDDKGQYPESVDALKGVLTQWSEVAVNPEYEKARRE